MTFKIIIIILLIAIMTDIDGIKKALIEITKGGGKE